jgi:hypothetical protein
MAIYLLYLLRLSYIATVASEALQGLLIEINSN